MQVWQPPNAMSPAPWIYGGLGLRFFAWIIDYLIVMAANNTFYAIMTGHTPLAPKDFDAMMGLSGLMFSMSYHVLFLERFGATPGKLLFGLRVITAQGLPISYGRAVGRFFAGILSGLLCYIGYFIAFADVERRTLHDRMCKTRVIRKR